MLSELSLPGITSDQGWADLLGIDDNSVEISHVLEKEKMQDTIDIPPPQDSPITPDLRPSYLSRAPFDDIPIPKSRPKRITRVPARYQGFALIASGYTQGYGQGSEIVPETYAKALASADAIHWKKAMDEEFNSLMVNNTWKLVKQPERKGNVLKGRWVFRIKRNLQGEIVRYKTRWVVKSNLQKYGINYNEIYTSVVKTICFKMIFKKAAKGDLEIEQLDMVTAFLNSLIADGLLIYVEQPTGYETLEDLVCLLLQMLYGLKQSPCL